MSKPLAGYRIIELAGIGPGPYAGMLLADMGAEVILINRPQGPLFPDIANRGKTTLTLDLRKPKAVTVLLELVKTADGLFEGLRPGVTERLGVGPTDCQSANPKLVYGRMTGWGQTGPWAKKAGHDINYMAITGALAAMGKADEPPMVPLNLIGDYGGGSLFLVMGMLAALLQAEKTGKGEIVDAAIIDGTSSLMTLFYTLSTIGQWEPKRESNLLDGGRPYYRCYETSDGGYMAIGCIEPQFFAEFLRRLNINAESFGRQNDAKKFAEQTATLNALFKTKTRKAWSDIFDESDACVTPVLNYEEAPHHPQNKARGGLTKTGPFIHPRSAPVFGDTAHHKAPNIPENNDAAQALLTELGYSSEAIETLAKDRVIGSL